MCGRYGQLESTIKSFGSDRGYQWKIEGRVFPDNYNLSPGNRTAIFRSEEGQGITVESARFGYRPFFNPSMMMINARAEGKEKKEKLNVINDPSYSGPWNIGKSGMFATAVKEHRCAIPVDYFIEGPEKEKLAKPYKIERKDGSPFSLAGIWSFTEESCTIAVITTAAAPLLQKVGHHRSPMVLTKATESIWLDKSLSYNELSSLFHPFDSSDFHALPLSSALRRPNRTDNPNNDPSLIEPIGAAIA